MKNLMKNIQVELKHYRFNNYFDKSRWASTWHQLDEIIKLDPLNVLEIGPGAGIIKFLLTENGINVDTTDIDPDLKPDFVASVTDLPFEDNKYGCVCAFQVLEHLPYKESLKAFSEMVRVAEEYIIISLPNSKFLWPYSFFMPKVGNLKFFIPKPVFKKQIHKFDGQHYWEINKKHYSLKKIIKDFTSNNVEIVKHYRVHENPYHHFFIFKKNQVLPVFDH